MGYGAKGRLGHGSEGQQLLPRRIDGLPLCRLTVCGGEHSGVLDQDLNVWMWGSNECGQLGLTARRDQHAFETQPRQLFFFKEKGVCSLHLGARHSTALTLYGLVYTWGSQDSGQLGHSEMSVDAQPLPCVVDSLMHRPVVQVVGCEAHSLAISVFEYPTADSPKFEAWKKSVQEEDEKKRKKADKAFLKFIRDEQKQKTSKASTKWAEEQKRMEEKSRQWHERREEGAQKASEHRVKKKQSAAQAAASTSQQRLLQARVVQKRFMDGSEEPEPFDVEIVSAIPVLTSNKKVRVEHEAEETTTHWKKVS